MQMSHQSSIQVVEQDLVIEDGQVTLYRTKLRLSFKHESADGE